MKKNPKHIFTGHLMGPRASLMLMALGRGKQSGDNLGEPVWLVRRAQNAEPGQSVFI